MEENGGTGIAMRVERPEYGGAFRLAGDAGAAPFVLPGELVRIADGLPEVIEPSPDRVMPECVHFGVCGGCQYQHAGYRAQLAIKQEVLGGLLGGAGLTELPAMRIHAAEPWGYRNRVRFRVERAASGELALGYSRRGTNVFLLVRMCPIAAPLIWRAAEALLGLARAGGSAGRWLESASEVEFFTTGDQSRLQMRLLLRDAGWASRREADFAGLCERLREHVPELVGAGAGIDPELGRRLRRAWVGAAWGADGLAYEVAGRRYWVGRGAFFQVNRFLVDRLLELVTAPIGLGSDSGGLAWDLFAGVGLFSRVLAEQFGRVVAVEGGEAAAAALKHAARGGRDVPAWEAVHQAVLAYLAVQAVGRDRPERVVLDPPRAGLGAKGATLLRLIRPREIVYVSCDPVTLAADLRVLLAGDAYRVRTLDLVDLFPQTYHVETVVALVAE